MARKRFHGLQKVKLRASWSKYNLYNLTRLKLPPVMYQTYFQQKWAAKAATRAYHGEQVREKQWQKMFTPRLNAVVPMTPRYLAENDGSELAAGRGSGRDVAPGENPLKRLPIPYMHMTYAPLERRLDMAVWRALFASSARQARQMVVHGQVKVNGQKMPYPGYLLNPGDMFQVEPDRVLFATGDTKDVKQAREGRQKRRVKRRMNTLKEERRLQRRTERATAKATKEAAASEDLTVRAKPVKIQIPRTEAEQRKETRIQLMVLLKQARSFIEGTKLGAKKKQAVRAYAKDIKTAVAMVLNKKSDIKEIEKTFIALAARLSQVTDIELVPGAKKEEAPAAAASEASKETEAPEEELSAEDQKALREAIARIRENPVDNTKSYATPWRPRPYMSAFAFIPRYLEVNQLICSAVYLRHPVARPNLAEVPTPFGAETQQLAFNWYLRRR